ncbi:MAG: hypothetical protein AAFX06_33835 [Planctomycetota bacterium]
MQSIELCRSVLSERSADWRPELLALNDEVAISVSLAATSLLMLPYWESRYERDDEMARLVDAISTWATNPDNDPFCGIRYHLNRAGEVKRASLSPVWPTPVGSVFPGDYAGDAIVAAANAICEMDAPAFSRCSEDCLSLAVKTIAEMMGHREPFNETTDFLALSETRLRDGILARLTEWQQNAA